MPENISPVAIEDKMKDAYLSYSLSVIVGRALPDVRDGLKPVHRRILYASSDLGLTHDKSHKKSARIVGEVLGKYHPHGDAAVYDAMVRMAQDFNQRYLLIDGHGNFGSLDGDSPAAMRYTEARLTSLSEEILVDINKNTVDFEDNFDGSLKEPLVLPSRIPNLLINGSSGIAVGMSTSIPPHNLNEVISALKYLLKHPGAKLDTIMKNFLPGPDFPTGANIIGNKGIKKAYQTGKGKLILRGTTKMEKSGRKSQIIITEIPYQVNKAKLIEEIAGLVNDNKITEITDVRDETDKDGLRVVIELKQGTENEIVLNRLYKYTSLQTNYRINLLALVDNRPEVMDLLTLLNHFLDFRRQIITRRTRYNLEKAQDRYHILEGLIKAISNLDLVISIIRNSESTQKARDSLADELDITDRQARAILEMQLQRLVGMEIKKIKSQRNELKHEIKSYKNILDNPDELDQVLYDELQEIKDKYGDDRKTNIIENEEKARIKKKDLIKEKKAVITYSYRQNIKRTDTRDKIKVAKNDHIIDISEGVSLNNLLLFNATGKVYSLPVHTLPEYHALATGDKLSNFIKIPLKENIVKMFCLNDYIQENYITLATAAGYVKKTVGSDYKTNYSKIKAIKLNDDDKVIKIAVTDDRQEILLGTKKGMTIRFKEDSINDTGRNTIGSRGIKLEDSDEVVSMNIVKDDRYVISISESGCGNKINLLEFKLQNRNGKGLKTATSGSYDMTAIITATDEDILLLITDNDSNHLINVSDIYKTQRPGKMYQLVDLQENSSIVRVIKLPLPSLIEEE